MALLYVQAEAAGAALRCAPHWTQRAVDSPPDAAVRFLLARSAADSMVVLGG